MPQAAAAQAQAAGAPAMGAIDARALAAALAGAASGSLQQQVQRAPGPSLTEVLTPEIMIPLLKEPGVLERLAPYMPVLKSALPDCEQTLPACRCLAMWACAT